MRIAAAALACALAAAANAATYRVDDAATLPSETTATMHWRSLAPSRNASHDVEGTSVVTVRLNTAPWLNRNGKIYMALPAQPIGELSAEWSTQGRLLPGKVTSGNRTLVYAGPIRAAVLEDTIVLRISADGRRLASSQRLQFNFEIDVE